MHQFKHSSFVAPALQFIYFFNDFIPGFFTCTCKSKISIRRHNALYSKCILVFNKCPVNKVVNLFFNLAQFTFTRGQKSEYTDDFIFKSIIDPVMCAKLCVEFDNFTCNSFDFCPGDPQGSCRLSRRHISEGSTHLVKGGGCDHFSSMTDSVTKTNDISFSLITQ